jgi:hypothetical protein
MDDLKHDREHSTVLEEDEHITMQQAKEDMELFGDRPLPLDPEESDEMKAHIATLRVPISRRQHSSGKAAEEKTDSQTNFEMAKSPILAEDKSGSVLSSASVMAFPSFSADHGAVPLDTWLNYTQPPIGAEILRVDATTQNPNYQEEQMETNDIEIFRNVHLESSPEKTGLRHELSHSDAAEQLEFGARIFYRNILDQYPNIPLYLARRLAEANQRRAARLELSRRCPSQPEKELGPATSWLLSTIQQQDQSSKETVEPDFIEPLDGKFHVSFVDVVSNQNSTCAQHTSLATSPNSVDTIPYTPYAFDSTSVSDISLRDLRIFLPVQPPTTAASAPRKSMPLPPENAIASSASSSPKPAPISRYSSSFSQRRARLSSGGGSKDEGDNNSSGKVSATSSAAQPGSGVLAEAGAGSQDSIQQDDENISDFLKMLDLKKDLRSFQASGDSPAADADTRRTSAALNRFHRMKDSNANLRDIIPSIPDPSTDERSFWSGQRLSTGPQSDNSSSTNISLQRPNIEYESSLPPTERGSISSADGLSAPIFSLPPPPVELGAVDAFSCDICGKSVQILRKRDWQ